MGIGAVIRNQGDVTVLMRTDLFNWCYMLSGLPGIVY